MIIVFFHVLGIMLSYVTALLFGVSPSPGVCVMRRLGQPIATSLIYVSLATKTVRLFRIFRASMKTARRPKFISSTFQVGVTLAITGIPVSLGLLTLPREIQNVT